MLDVKNVSKTFAKGTVNEHIALEKINLHLDRGEFLTIVGSNGAGKSTLFNLICGTFMQDSGTVTLDGQDISFLPGTQACQVDRPGVPGPDEGHRTEYDH